MTHAPLAVVLLIVAMSMAAKDATGTLLTVAEAKGRAWLAGILDSAGDLASVVCTAYGAGEIILHGWSARSVEILLVMCTTSLFGTAFWTKVGRNIKEVPKLC